MGKSVIFLLLFILLACNLDEIIKPQNPTYAPVLPLSEEKIIFLNNFRIVYLESDTPIRVVYDANARLGQNGVVDESITYSLSGDDAAFFEIDPQTGAIEHKAENNFNKLYKFSITALTGNLFKTIAFKLVYLNENSSSQSFSDFQYIDNSIDGSQAIYSVDLFRSSELKIGYGLDGRDQSFFKIDEQGVLYLDEGKNLESNSVYNVTIDIFKNSDGQSTKKIAAVDLEIQKGKVIKGLPESTTTLSLAEDTAIGNQIYDINAKIDNGVADAGITYSLSPSSSPFQIDSNTGKLTLKSALDYETTTSYDLTLTATSQAQASLSKSFTLTIQVSNVQEINGLPTSNISKTLKENFAVGDEIYDVNAKIDSGTADADITYSLSPSSSPFQIDSSTGRLTLKSALDYETTTSYSLTLTASSQTQANLSKSFTLAINISNVQQINGLPTSNISKTLKENFAVGDEIYDVNARIDNGEADAGITYSLNPSPSPFSIDSNTGKLTLKSVLDYETTTSYDLTLTATSQAQASLSASFTLTIQVSDAQEINGLPATDLRTLAENSTINTEIYDVNARIDNGEADAGITYSLSPSSSPFQIDSSTGRLTLKSVLDYETTTSYSLTLTATSQAQASLSASFTLTIQVSNVQEINGLPATDLRTLAENSTINTEIYDVNARIDNGEADAGITYSLNPSPSPFSIDSNTGKLTLKSVLDYETTTSYDLTLTATSQAQASLSASFTLTIQVSDAQEINGLPATDLRTLAENSTINTEIYDVNARIDNGEADAGITYSLSPSSSPFQIDSSTGRLTLKSVLDYETTTSYSLTLTATSQAQASLSASFTLTIQVSNVQEINGLPATDLRTLAENSTINTEIYDVNARIDNGEADAGITYSLNPSPSPFSIDSNTGKLTLKSTLDYETTTSYDLTLTATSQAQASLSASFTLTIQVSDAQEINGLPATDLRTLAENSTINTEIYDVNARIDNGEADAGITYSLSPSSSPFQIDSSTGKLTLKSVLDYETTTSYDLTLTASFQAQTSLSASFTLTIQVSNVQEISGLPVSDVKTFAENTALNTEIYDVNAKIDNGVADTGISYSLATSSSPFQINSNTGKLTLKSVLDYETTTNYSLTLTASSQTQANLSKSFTLTIQVSNVQEINGLPTSDVKTFAENTALNTEIYDINAKIDSGAVDAGISYSLTPSSSPFQINSNTGKLTLKSVLDYETTTSYDLTLTASFQAQTSLSASFTLTIQVSNVQEISGLPVSDVKTFAENTALNTEIYDVNAKIDNGVADTGISYSLAPSSSPFQINSNTGKLTLKSALDYETTTSYDLTLTASSSTPTNLNASFTLTIKVSNVQEINGLPVSDVKTFAENTALNTEIYDINAKIDSGAVDAGISYSLTPSSSPFQINSNTGKLTLKSVLDYETTTSYDLTLTASSQTQTSLSASFTLIVSVTNVPEQISGLPTNNVNLAFAENTSLDSEIYDVNAKIDSGAVDAGISYSLTPSSSPFQINSNTGKLTLKSVLDYETTTSYDLTLTASSQTQTSLSASFTLIVSVTNVPEQISGLPTNNVNLAFAENTSLDSEIYDVNAKIDNGVADAGITYSLSPSSSPFQIDSTTGKLTLKSALDYETTTSYDLTLTASSQAQASLSKSFTLAINISNVQEINGLPTSNISKTLKENFAVGDEIYDVNAKIDSGAADTGITYSLSPSGTPFQIDSSTGKLTLTQSLAGKVGENYSLNIGVQTTNNAALSAVNNAALQTTLEINITIILLKDFYLWLVKPDGTKLDAELPTTSVHAGYKYEAEVANPEILTNTTFSFQWQLRNSKSAGSYRYIYRKTFSSSNGKSYYIPPKEYEDYYLNVEITYGNESKRLFSHAALQEAPSSQDLSISWINKTRNNVSLDATNATIEVGDELSYDLSDWLAYTGLSSVQTEWRVVLENGDHYYNNVPQGAAIVLGETYYKDSTIQLIITASYENESWILSLKSKVKITNTDEGVIGGKLSLDGRDLRVEGTTLTVGERADFSDLVDHDGLEDVEFSYTWYLLDEKEATSFPAPAYGMQQSKARSIYLNAVPADVGKYLMLKVSYTDLGGFRNEYTIRSAEPVAASPNIDQSQGEVVFDRQWQFSKIPLVIKTNQTGERYVWRIFKGNSQRPLDLVSATDAEVISLSAAYADDYGFQTSEEQITLQFEKTGNYYVTLEVFPAIGASQNFISEQLGIQSSFIRGGKNDVANN